MIPELINKFYEDKLISKNQYQSLSPLKKDYDKKLGNFLIDGEYITKKDLITFFKENKDFLFQIFDKWMKENSKIANAIIWRSKDSNKSQNEAHNYKNGLKIKKKIFLIHSGKPF